jgi:hypothetical protein
LRLGGRGVVNDDIDKVRTALLARRDECWRRLEDAVGELLAVHEVMEQEITTRIARIVGDEREAAEASGTAH